MTTDSKLAAQLAHDAGELLLKVRMTDDTDDARALGKRGDRTSNNYLLTQLGKKRPGDAVLSEESIDDPTRLDATRVWIIDPLDGTREFGMSGRNDWAVHVALWEARAGITAAAVAQPSRGIVYASHSTTARKRHGERLRILVSDTRPPAFADAVAARIGGELTAMGSAGAKAMAVLRGDADVYLHAGGQWEWDSAAPVGVAQAAGLHASRIDGSELRYNQPHPYLPDLLICRPELAGQLLTAIEGEVRRRDINVALDHRSR